MSDVRIHMRHIRMAKMCSGGARAFFENNNLDWNKFLQEGLLASEIAHIDDEMVRAVIAHAREEEGQPE